MKTIAEFINFQKEFDSKHSGKYNWSTKIDEDNIHILEHILLATVGEVGEAANILKKVIRGDRSFEDSKQDISEEITDIFIYVLKLIYQMDIDIESEYKKKMNFNQIRFEKYKK